MSLRSSSLKRSHRLSLQVPLAALRFKIIGPKSGLETSNANDTHSLALLTQFFSRKRVVTVLATAAAAARLAG